MLSFPEDANVAVASLSLHAGGEAFLDIEKVRF